jgi:hypothetical protein
MGNVGALDGRLRQPQIVEYLHQAQHRRHHGNQAEFPRPQPMRQHDLRAELQHEAEALREERDRHAVHRGAFERGPVVWRRECRGSWIRCRIGGGRAERTLGVMTGMKRFAA